MKVALTIAGHDPSSGAGITADLTVFAAHGLFGISCITALTVQSTISVRETHPTSAQLLQHSLEYLTSDILPDGIKVGMLATAPTVTVVAEFLRSLRTTHPGIPVVLDPVLRSSSGRELIDLEGLQRVREQLLDVIDWITPNLDELAALTGRKVTTAEDVLEASQALQHMHPALTILATGGHLDPPDDFLLTPSSRIHRFPGKLIRTTSTHGTGCALSSSLLANLVLGMSGPEAAEHAKAYVADCIRSAQPLGKGKGPLNLSSGTRPRS